MMISVFLFVIINVSLVLTDDNVAMESNVGYQDTKKAISETADEMQVDQIAESSHSVGQTYETGVLKNARENDQNLEDYGKNGVGNVQQVVQQSSSDPELLQPALTQGYLHQGQPIYVQYPLQPIRIFGAEASALYQNQIHENEPHTLGYSSYVEHVSPKDEEEIKSALKEGSVSDIKRLVPKSGMSFKIYKTEKNLENSKSNLDLSQYSKLQNIIKTPQQNNIQTAYQQPQQPAGGLGSLQQIYQQHGLENSNPVQSDAASYSYEAITGKTHYYTQPEIKNFLENKNQPQVKTNFKINVEDNSYGKIAEYSTLAVNRGSKHGLSDFKNYPKQMNFDTKTEGSQKAVKKLKPGQNEIDPVALTERNKVQYAQINSHVGQNLNKHNTNFDDNLNYRGSYTGKGNQNFVLGKKGYSDKKTVKNRQQADSQVYRGSQSEYYPTATYADNEPAKSGQHVITHVDAANFDHQKALEGSTSFDIKNAIDTTGSLIHQSDDVSKHQLEYVIPKIPTSTVALDSGVHETPIVEGHTISSPQLSYHTIPTSEVSGKFFHRPQTLVWSSEHLKQGNALTGSDLHQPLIKLHLPKEEYYQHAPNIELPTSHFSFQQKQPFVVHYDSSFLKYPQEIHFQPKTKTRGNIKLGQPLAIDWSLFKSTFPNFNGNSIIIKPELTSHVQETGKKIVPILIRKRKNRSNTKQEIGMVVYGKVNNKRKPMKPIHRQEKNIRVNLLPEASSNIKQYEPKGERKNEFSVSASYKVDRSYKTK